MGFFYSLIHTFSILIFGFRFLLDRPRCAITHFVWCHKRAILEGGSESRRIRGR